jgi:hypothetical protein
MKSGPPSLHWQPSPSSLAWPRGSPALALQVSRVADRPLVLHTEAPNRLGQGTRLALPPPVDVIHPDRRTREHWMRLRGLPGILAGAAYQGVVATPGY